MKPKGRKAGRWEAVDYWTWINARTDPYTRTRVRYYIWRPARRQGKRS